MKVFANRHTGETKLPVLPAIVTLGFCTVLRACAIPQKVKQVFFVLLNENHTETADVFTNISYMYF